MNHTIRAIVGLDLTESDRPIIQYVDQHLTRFGSIEKIYCIHAEKDLEFPEELHGLTDDAPKDEQIVKLMQSELSDSNIQALSEVMTVEDDPFHAILHWADIKKANLIVLGRKPEEKGSGIVAERLARKSHASILFVPNTSQDLKTILVSIDFSKHAKMALQKAIQIAQSAKAKRIVCLNVYEVPTGYYKTGKSFEEVAAIMKMHAERKLNDFLKEFTSKNLEIEARTTLKDKTGIPAAILNVAESTHTDLIVVGSKGQSLSSWILLGSVTERLITLNRTFPLFIVKKEDENMGFWKALKLV